MIDKDHSFKRMTAIMSLGEGETIETVAEALHEAGFDIYQPSLGLATTAELLDELSARNRVGQMAKFQNNADNAESHIERLRLAFSIRRDGLAYRTVDE